MPLPPAVTPWVYTPEDWQLQPEHAPYYQEAMLQFLWNELGHVGGDGLDVGSMPSGSMDETETVEDEDEDQFAEGPLTSRLDSVVQEFKSSKKKGDPADDADASTTAGTRTTATTGTTASSSSTTGTTGLM